MTNENRNIILALGYTVGAIAEPIERLAVAVASDSADINELGARLESLIQEAHKFASTLKTISTKANEQATTKRRSN